MTKEWQQKSKEWFKVGLDMLYGLETETKTERTGSCREKMFRLFYPWEGQGWIKQPRLKCWEMKLERPD